MLPANDQIALGWVVAVVTKIAAAILEFNPDLLPAIPLLIDASFGFAIGKSRSLPLCPPLRNLQVLRDNVDRVIGRRADDSAAGVDAGTAIV